MFLSVLAVEGEVISTIRSGAPLHPSSSNFDLSQTTIISCSTTVAISLSLFSLPDGSLTPRRK